MVNCMQKQTDTHVHNQHGGKRPGSGRKSKYGTKTTVIRVPIEAVPEIQRMLAEKFPQTAKASLACQIRTNIRCEPEMTYQTLAAILRKEIPLNLEIHANYLYGFFEECYPKLMKKFMSEQNILREDIINIFYLLPERGEKNNFRKALINGEF